MNPWGYGLRVLRRWRRRTASVEGVTRVGVVRHRWCRRLPSPLLHFSTGSPFGHHPRLRMVCPLWGQWVRAGRFLFSLPLHFSTLHFSTSPRVHPSGITRGYAWCVPAGDSEWTMSYFFSYQEKQTLGRNVFSHSCGLICRAQKYNKGVS